MANCSYCKVILKKSQTKGSRTQSMGVSPSPSSSFSPLFKGPGAGGCHMPPSAGGKSSTSSFSNPRMLC